MRVKNYRHVARSSAAVAAVGTAYASGKRISLETSYWPDGQPFRGGLQSLSVYVSSISSAASITWRLTRDTDGDESIITDVTGALTTGITTATDGSVNFKLNYDVSLESGDTFYLWIKTDAGTVTVDQAVLLWGE